MKSKPGSFDRRVAAAMPRMPRIHTVHLEHVAPGTKSALTMRRMNWPTSNERLEFTDKLVLSAYLELPYHWEYIAEEDWKDLMPVKVLYDLPIAIHQAGSSLRDLSISCFPTPCSLKSLLPDFNDGEHVPLYHTRDDKDDK